MFKVVNSLLVKPNYKFFIGLILMLSLFDPSRAFALSCLPLDTIFGPAASSICQGSCNQDTCFFDAEISSEDYYLDSACGNLCNSPNPVCGNSKVDEGEECDDGNARSGDGCSSSCMNEGAPEPVCGNGIVEAGEECDDSNLNSGDSCSASCTIESAGAECWSLSTIFGNASTPLCQASCGQADCYFDPEVSSEIYFQDNVCRVPCHYEPAKLCGDGMLEAGEECDDGNSVSGDGCSSSCMNEGESDPVCGNARLEANEQCDDGNLTNGDGCDSSCDIEFIGGGECEELSVIFGAAAQPICQEACEQDICYFDPEVSNEIFFRGDSCSVTCKKKPAVCDSSIELILNPSFETPVVSSHAWDVFPNGTNSLLWNIEWESGQSIFNGQVRPLVANLEVHRGLNSWSSSDGQQHAELDGDWGGPSSEQSSEPASVKISQNITTIPGQDYTLSFDFSPRPGSGLTQNKLSVRWNGETVETISADGLALNSPNWINYKFNLRANSESSKIEFADIGVSDSVGTLLDNVSLRCGATVIEPVCGNGIVEDGEECDDVNSQTCSNTCKLITHECYVVDFDNLQKGEVVDRQYDSIGIKSISAYTIADSNNSWKNKNNRAIIFDSSRPSGFDFDLGTPNQAFGGPGLGSGGASNNQALEKILIIAENMDDRNKDGFIDDPDDNLGGGIINIEFSNSVNLNSLMFIDVHEDDVRLNAYKNNGNSQKEFSLNIPKLGDNSVQTVELDAESKSKKIKRLEIELDGLGAIDMLNYCINDDNDSDDNSSNDDDSSSR